MRLSSIKAIQEIGSSFTSQIRKIDTIKTRPLKPDTVEIAGKKIQTLATNSQQAKGVLAKLKTLLPVHKSKTSKITLEDAIAKTLHSKTDTISLSALDSTGDIEIKILPDENIIAGVSDVTHHIPSKFSDSFDEYLYSAAMSEPKIIDKSPFGQLIEKYSSSISSQKFPQAKEEITQYFKSQIDNIDSKLLTATDDEFAELCARKTALEYAQEHIILDQHGLFKKHISIGLPTKTCELQDVMQSIEDSTIALKKENVFSLSDIDPKKRQFDADDVMEKYNQQMHEMKQWELNNELDPIHRLKDYDYFDPHLHGADTEFYRIISKDELKNLIRTIATGEDITAKGHFTMGDYSCITTNRFYNDQCFAANGVPIRLKFKTHNPDGTLNMNFYNKVGTIKPERSVYGIHGYNFDDIDWSRISVQENGEWKDIALNKDNMMSLAQWATEN